MLTNKRGDVLFRVPVGGIRCRRGWPLCFTIEWERRRWRELWLIALRTFGAQQVDQR